MPIIWLWYFETYHFIGYSYTLYYLFFNFLISDNKNDTCKDDEFRCKADKKCISYDLVCDKVPHCSDNSDEPLHCGKRECARVEDNGCGHICIDTKEGFRCACNAGYKLMADGKACQDINECNEVGKFSWFMFSQTGDLLFIIFSFSRISLRAQWRVCQHSWFVQVSVCPRVHRSSLRG